MVDGSYELIWERPKSESLLCTFGVLALYWLRSNVGFDDMFIVGILTSLFRLSTHLLTIDAICWKVSFSPNELLN